MKTTQAKILFIVPVFNVNRYLRECLQSLSEVQANFDVLIIDDRGDENPMPIIEPFLTFSNFKYIKNKENLGLGFARNEGLKRIPNDITHVYFVDSDDYVIPEKIDLAAKCLRKGETILMSQFISNKLDGKSLQKSTLFSKEKISYPGYVWGSFWACESIKQIQFTRRKWEDLPWVWNVYKTCEFRNFKNIDFETYVYRMRKSSISNRDVKNQDSLIDLVRVLNDSILDLNTNSIDDKAKTISKHSDYIYTKYFQLAKPNRKNLKIVKYRKKVIVYIAVRVSNFFTRFFKKGNNGGNLYE